MTMSFLRMIAVLVLLLAGATFSFCPSVVATMVEVPAADHCCGNDQNVPDQPLPADGCAATECGCVTCLTVIPSTQVVALSAVSTNALHPPRAVPHPPAGFLASIDYPPETV